MEQHCCGGQADLRKKAFKLKEKYKEGIVVYWTKGKLDAGGVVGSSHQGWGGGGGGFIKTEKSKKKKEEEEDKKDEEWGVVFFFSYLLSI